MSDILSWTGTSIQVVTEAVVLIFRVINSFIRLIWKLITILPTPLDVITIGFMSMFAILITYKFIRKG